MKELNIKVILLQIFGMIFLINGILQLRFYTVSEKIIWAETHSQYQHSQYWNKLLPANEGVFNFWPSVYVWIFLGSLIGICILAFVNWKSKLSSLNTIIVAIVLYILLRVKFFRKEMISQLFRPIRTFCSDDFGTQCLIEGIIFTFIGVTILYLSVIQIYLNSKKLS
ncbi:hypothetical protein SAMN05444671_3502 [Flavobacterium sp. CF108]|uniref:hypothetical protein n=1 Tax=unclassified Flavobacterium TaxID=196869 RepID=UPI0008CE4D0F|nr:MULTISPECIES: hypothetical protein [unclassified Flavobacterium]SEO45971.1 hypothetical protein SAMN04487978_2936 [Flavobacterium sp. fv08]SHH70134.1 hypothetical protein SAMN05444671_3502 [Flavobacterium sp. CF108]